MYLKDSKIIVIKIGSSLLIDDKKKVRRKWLTEFAKDIQELIKQNKKVIIVSSGAIAMGCKKLNISKKNLKIDKSQAVASIGQIELMNLFSETFVKLKINISQILLTLEDTEQRRRALNAKRTFDNLGGFTEEHFDEKPSKITFPPNTIAVTTLDPEFLTIRELLGKIKFLKVLGISNYKEKTYLYHKLVTPLAFIIICLLGMPFVVLVRKANKMVNVIIALVISFGFWWMMSVTLSMGEMGYIPPILSAFLPIILSSGLIYYEFKKL